MQYCAEALFVLQTQPVDYLVGEKTICCQFLIKMQHIEKFLPKLLKANINIILGGILSGSAALHLKVYFGYINFNKNPVEIFSTGGFVCSDT